MFRFLFPDFKLENSWKAYQLSVSDNSEVQFGGENWPVTHSVSTVALILVWQFVDKGWQFREVCGLCCKALNMPFRSAPDCVSDEGQMHLYPDLNIRQKKLHHR